jgi:dihydrofolate reductase
MASVRRLPEGAEADDETAAGGEVGRHVGDIGGGVGDVLEGVLREDEVEPLVADVGVGGAGLASAFTKLGLVDEYRLFVSPVVLGGGTRYFPALDDRIDLELAETRTFGSRVVYMRYRRV